MEPMLASVTWSRPDPDSVIGFLLLFALYTLGGLAIWHHRRIFMRGPMASVLFLIAIGYGFAVSLWVVDRIGIYEPYSVAPSSTHRERSLEHDKPFPTESASRDASSQD